MSLTSPASKVSIPFQAKTFDAQLKAELQTIKQKLISSSKSHPAGVYWETMGLDTNGDVKWEQSESLYCGVGGIAWFFLQHYLCFKDKESLLTARKSISWCKWYIEQDKPYSSAYITGRLGLSILFMEFNKIEPSNELPQLALKVFKQCTDGPFGNAPIDDFINGTSGKLQALMQLHELLPNPEILSKIKDYAWQLVEKGWVNKQGVYWDRGGQQICGLCGFSHGVSGFAHVFEQLAVFFKDNSWLYVMHQAFAYEDYYYQKPMGNWPDLRRGAYTPDEIEKYKHEFSLNNRHFFERFNDMNAWCHGAAGIGLARLNAWKSTGDVYLKKSAVKAINKTIETEISDTARRYTYTLCHGGGGNADLFIEAYQTFNQRKYLKMAQQVAAASFDNYRTHGFIMSGYNQGGEKEDTSLFMGMAGVGYFYLRTINPNKVPSVLLPRITTNTTTNNAVNSATLVAIQKKLVNRYFPQTLNLLPPNGIFEGLGKNLLTDFTAAVKNHLQKNEDKELTKIFKYELSLLNFDLKAPSHSWLSIKRTMQVQEQIPALETGDLYQLDEDVKLIKYKGDYQLVTRNSGGNHVESIPNFTYGVLEQLKTAKTANELITTICMLFGDLDQEEKQEVSAAVSSQLQEAIKSGVVCVKTI